MSLIDKLAIISQPEFEKLFLKMHREIVTDPIKNFVSSTLFMNTELAPGQMVLFKIVSKIPLDETQVYKVFREVRNEDNEFDLESEYLNETEIYERLTEKPYSDSKLINATDISLIVGRRGGKSLTSAILAIYSAIKRDWKPLLGKHNTATVLVMSHTREFSDEIIDVVRSLIEESPVLSRLIDEDKKNTQSTINLKVPFLYGNRIKYSRVRIRTVAASSKSTRGSACPVILADEIAFWGSDVNSKETDKQIIDAVAPSMLQFGDQAMFIKLSSPGIKQGVLWNTYCKRHTLPKSSLVMKAPSWVFNNRYDANIFRDEHQKDEGSFDTEYRANFVESISSFISPEFVDMCVTRGLKFSPPEPDVTAYAAAIDAAFKGDRFTFSLVSINEQRVKHHVMKIWEGSRQNPVSAFEVAKYIKTVCNEFNVSTIHADQYSFQPLKEIFDKFGLILMENPFSNTFKKQIYFNLKRLVHNHQIELLDNEILIREVKQLQVEQSPTGAVKIGHPPGGTDDAADSTAIAAYLVGQKGGSVSFESGGDGLTKYNIQLDQTGKSFTAPSPEMLGDLYGYDIDDNSSMYELDPDTGKVSKYDGNGGGDGPDFTF